MGATANTSPTGNIHRAPPRLQPSHLEAVNPSPWAAHAPADPSARRQAAGPSHHPPRRRCFAGRESPPNPSTWPRSAASIGGTLHIITNNLLGFTANPKSPTPPVRHRPRQAPAHPHLPRQRRRPRHRHAHRRHRRRIRQRFHSDIVVDLIGYRRYGHKEANDPTVTQPRRYAAIRERPFLYKLYANPSASIRRKPKPSRRSSSPTRPASQQSQSPSSPQLPEYWKPTTRGELTKPTPKSPPASPPSASSSSQRLSNGYPAGFHIHPKIQKLYEQRVEMAKGKRLFDYGAAELLAYASLLTQGTPVRLAGQDPQRGTFNNATPSSSTWKPKSATRRSIT